MEANERIVPSWRYQVVEWVCVSCGTPLVGKAAQIDVVRDDGHCYPLYVWCRGCGSRYTVSWGQECSIVRFGVFGPSSPFVDTTDVPPSIVKEGGKE